jgi:hypothetical protein
VGDTCLLGDVADAMCQSEGANQGKKRYRGTARVSFKDFVI